MDLMRKAISGIVRMRKAVSGVILVLVGIISQPVLDRLMSNYPELVAMLSVACILGGLIVVVLSDPVLSLLIRIWSLLRRLHFRWPLTLNPDIQKTHDQIDFITHERDDARRQTCRL